MRTVREIYIYLQRVIHKYKIRIIRIQSRKQNIRVKDEDWADNRQQQSAAAARALGLSLVVFVSLATGAHSFGVLR